MHMLEKKSWMSYQGKLLVVAGSFLHYISYKHSRFVLPEYYPRIAL